MDSMDRQKAPAHSAHSPWTALRAAHTAHRAYDDFASLLKDLESELESAEEVKNCYPCARSQTLPIFLVAQHGDIVAFHFSFPVASFPLPVHRVELRFFFSP